ncbi:hypothetical protein [Ruegeria sp. PrR005]|uniref:Uncharacterized protein n=1 Tax=Ruegeria sp. PrR005 TaxID=2706882 RepID=A0A6B2NX55_9RHOB|nr:hypothetical protein [Ruegeria sp. PrR005]NDW47333.1 hypothetical protein [Ruegeria sp. PrR005]
MQEDRHRKILFIGQVPVEQLLDRGGGNQDTDWGRGRCQRASLQNRTLANSIKTNPRGITPVNEPMLGFRQRRRSGSPRK